MPVSHTLPNLIGILVDEGRLRLLDVLGAGSYGVGYRALDAQSPSDTPAYYAVKCLGFGTRYDKREIDPHTMCSECSPHPSILTFHRQFYTHGCLCVTVVLELSAGDLWDAIETGVFDGNNILVEQVFLQLIDAARFCHERGIHHRDQKPENILCSQDGTNVRVADFGMALDEELPCSVVGGSNSYMTPGAVASSDPCWHSFLSHDHYLSRNCAISAQLNDLLRRCFNPIPAERPSLVEQRFHSSPRPLSTRTSAPSTCASFYFNPSDYPSPATSNGSSAFIDITPVRLSELTPSCYIWAGPNIHVPSTEIPALSAPELADFSPASQEMISCGHR
ncbi:kinase-like domain-containing protein [Mycena vulgaris]|nr:kinase-like domain-containing protein [Mycena vulgaris]